MKQSKGINILLIILLTAVIGAMGFFGFKALTANKKIEVPDFLGKSASEVYEWCGQLDPKYSCEIIYEPSKSVEKDIVFQQSLNAGSQLVDKITFRICDEKINPVILPQLYEAKKADIENWAKTNNIQSVTFTEEESDTVEKGIIIRIEPQQDIYTDTPVTVVISSGKAIDTTVPIEVKSGDYVGFTEEKFIEQAKSLGLVPFHNTSRDSNSSSVAKGNVVWHGSGTYQYGETINYGLSTSSSSNENIYVQAGDYIGDSEEDFKAAATKLGLKANHNTSRDAYSDTVKKGYIVWHGSGNYEKNETFNYGLSLGSSSGEIYVKYEEYLGKTESEFKTIATNLGLKANHNTSRDAYSDTVAKGNIVWHGSGTYEKDETFNYGLSLGKKDDSSSDEIIVKSEQYVGKTESEFKTIATNLGLKANHRTAWDDYSDTIAKGSVIWHGYGTYEKDETFNYGLSLGKKGDSTPTTTDIIVTNGQYVGKTESEFKTIATNLGLNPTHVSSRDAYSDTIAKGSIVTHGYGTYEKGEAFNYGLSLGKKDSSTDEIIVTNGQYVGKTESEFKTIGTNLGLKPNHNTSRDAYSDTVAKGNIVWHGYGTYEKGETFNYGLSLGKKDSTPVSTDIVVSAETYNGKTESEFRSITSGLGLSPNHNTDWDSYSDSIAKGSIVKHGSGTYKKGETINYGLSLGSKPVEPTTGYIMRPERYQVGSTYDATKTAMQNYLSTFTNVEYIGVSSTRGVGQLEKIEVNGSSSYSAGDYPSTTPIKVYIVNEQLN